MKQLNLFALVTLLGGASNAVLANTCNEGAGVCVCKGTCPSFTEAWCSQITTNSVCAAAKSCNSQVNTQGGSVIVNGKTYSSDSIDNCDGSSASGSGGSSTGTFGSSYYSSILMTAAAFVGGLAGL
jgi:hypothetical protein